MIGRVLVIVAILTTLAVGCWLAGGAELYAVLTD